MIRIFPCDVVDVSHLSKLIQMSSPPSSPQRSEGMNHCRRLGVEGPPIQSGQHDACMATIEIHNARIVGPALMDLGVSCGCGRPDTNG